MEKQNIILADCLPDEIESFKTGIEESTNKKFGILSDTRSKGKRSFFKNLQRYINYFSVPFKVFLHRNDYDIIVGWQQFFSNNFAFFCRLFRVKKSNLVVSCNFTYKRKKGIIGKIYYKFMKFALANNYIDYFHVLSHEYALRCSKELGIPEKKFLVTAFGIPDFLQDFKDSNAPCSDYVVSVGRSNRDFDFLLKVWAKPEMKDFRLVIISDTFVPSVQVPENVTIHNNIVGEAAKQWIFHSDALLLPIDDGNLASGDTVLLVGMQFEKPVIVTKPSTLAEMYIKNGENGWCLDKDVDSFADILASILRDRHKMETIGQAARQSYLKNFSRFSLGQNIGKGINR